MELSKNKKLYITILLLALAAVISVSTFVYAKYIKDKEYDENQVRAENFYFTVDLIGNSDSLDKIIEIYGETAVPFSVINYLDSERINSTNIQYTVSLTNSNGVSDVQLVDGNGVAVTSAPKTLNTGSKAEHEYTLMLPGKDKYNNDDEIIVTVKSTEATGYVKTLRLIFKLKSYESELSYYLIDEAVNTMLVVMADVEIPEDKIVIDWSTINDTANILQIDNNSAFVHDAGTLEFTKNPPPSGGFLSKITVSQMISSKQSFSIQFYKVPMGGVECVGSDGTKGSESDPIAVTKDANGVYTIVIKEIGA